MRALGRWQRLRARQLGAQGRLQAGALGFLQLFGSALQLTPHFHLVVPEGVWTQEGEFVALPPPRDTEVMSVLHRVLGRLRPRLALLEEALAQEEDVLSQAAAQRRVVEVPAQPPRARRRVAVAHGFSLHADTAVHAHDRQGLETLCRYGARGAVAESRLSRREDGQYEYRPKRGATLVLTAAALLNRLLALIPPARLHLTRYHGVFAPHAKLRCVVTRPETLAPAPEAGTDAKPPPPGPTPASRTLRRPRLDWAAVQLRTFGEDVTRCPCGGRRRVVALVTTRDTIDEVLGRLGLLSPRPRLPPATAPPQLTLAL